MSPAFEPISNDSKRANLRHAQVQSTLSAGAKRPNTRMSTKYNMYVQSKRHREDGQ